MTLLVDPQADVLRCEVVDDGTGFAARGREEGSSGGWGLDFVDQIAVSWGGVREGSTHVWFEMPRKPSAGR